MNQVSRPDSISQAVVPPDVQLGPLRVLYLVPDLGIGGAERHVTTLMPALDRARFEPYVICIGDEGVLFEHLVSADVPARALGRAKRQGLRTTLELSREFARIAPHVVLTRGYSAEALGRIAGRLAKVPHCVVWVHNCGTVDERGRLRRLADRLLDPSTSAYFGVARAQVDYMVEELGYPRAKVEIIHNGVDPKLIDPSNDRTEIRALGISDGNPVVAVIAALRPEKDHLNFLRAARLVLDSAPDARFLVVGEGPMHRELTEAARRLGISQRVVFTGARSDVPALLRGIDVFVLSSVTVECFPMALLEAMAAGRPAVCTAVGGVGELIEEGQTGYTVPPQDAQALASRIVELITDAHARARMGAAARRRVESEFSLSASVAATQAALERLVERSRPGDPVVLTVVLDLTWVGGVEVLLLNLFKSFDPAVVRPRLVCLREAGALAAEFKAAGFDVEVLERAGWYDTRTLPRLVGSLRRTNTDVVLVPHHHRAALLLGRVAAHLARVPVNVVAAHDMDLTSVGRRVLPAWAVSSLRISDALVLLSSAQGRYLHREEGVGRGYLSTVREVVIHNGIVVADRPTEADRAAARADLGVEAHHFVIGIVARLSPQKAHQTLFDAVASVKSTHPHVRLMVIGGGAREQELRNLSATLGIDDATRFLGVRDDVERLLPGLDVSCLSSVHEGVPIAILESMAAGLPIVATDCGSLRDLVTDFENGFIVPVGNAELLAERLRLLADDVALRTRLGEAGRRRAERDFEISETARRYERLLVELVERKRSRRSGAGTSRDRG